MSFEDSEEDSDLDVSQLMVPSDPPQKPPNLVNYYVEQNRNGPLSENELRQQWREGLGKTERQQWNRKHRKIMSRFEALKGLYIEHNPDYDVSLFTSPTRPRPNRSPNKARNNNNNNNNNTSSSSSRSRGGRRGGPARNNNSFFDSETYDDNNNNNNHSNRNKKRSRNQFTNDSVEDLFKGINSGGRRTVRDASKFDPSDDQKVQMKKLVHEMREAAKRDWQCNIEKKPAINTLKMLDIVTAELSKRLFYKHYLDETDILEAMRDWIHPLPDGSLPSEKIRSDMYRIIEKFALHDYEVGSLTDYLHWSETKSKDASYRVDIHPNLKSFAKTCMNLWAHKKETTSNKTLLRKIMEKWIRTITGSDRKYNDLYADMRENKELIKKRYKILQKQQRDFNFGEQKRAKIPEKAWHDFAVVPRSTVDPSEIEDLRKQTRSNNNNPFNDRINKAYKRTKTTNHAALPSVTGRRIRK